MKNRTVKFLLTVAIVAVVLGATTQTVRLYTDATTKINCVGYFSASSPGWWPTLQGLMLKTDRTPEENARLSQALEDMVKAVRSQNKIPPPVRRLRVSMSDPNSVFDPNAMKVDIRLPATTGYCIWQGRVIRLEAVE